MQSECNAYITGLDPITVTGYMIQSHKQDKNQILIKNIEIVTTSVY